jgi:hypothetical protein
MRSASRYAPEKSLELLKKAGFEKISEVLSGGDGERHYWILAKNKK